MRNDVSYIDNASAVLSNRGGKAFSVRSLKKDVLSKVSSLAASIKMDTISRSTNSKTVRKPYRTIETARNASM